MKLDTQYALELMDKTFHDLFNALPDKSRQIQPPTRPYDYRSESITQAIILKLAFVQSSLNAAILLLDKDFAIEPGILTRTIEEANEDIVFLSFAVTDKDTDLHKDYLEDFWEEDIEKTPNVRGREKIREEIHDYLEEKIPSIMANQPSYKTRSRVIYSLYSKFVHSTLPCIMQIYRENPPRFYTRGIPDTPNEESRYRNINLSIYGSLIPYDYAGKALKTTGEVLQASNLIKELHNYLNYVKKENNID